MVCVRIDNCMLLTSVCVRLLYNCAIPGLFQPVLRFEKFVVQQFGASVVSWQEQKCTFGHSAQLHSAIIAGMCHELSCWLGRHWLQTSRVYFPCCCRLPTTVLVSLLS